MYFFHLKNNYFFSDFVKANLGAKHHPKCQEGIIKGKLRNLGAHFANLSNISDPSGLVSGSEDIFRSMGKGTDQLQMSQLWLYHGL